MRARTFLRWPLDAARTLLARRVLADPVPCWCRKWHRPGYWHDPTHGQIDRDIQQRARDLLDLPHAASAVKHPQLVPIEQTLQHRRDAGLLLWWERTETTRP